MFKKKKLTEFYWKKNFDFIRMSLGWNEVCSLFLFHCIAILGELVCKFCWYLLNNSENKTIEVNRWKREAQWFNQLNWSSSEGRHKVCDAFPTVMFNLELIKPVCFVWFPSIFLLRSLSVFCIVLQFSYSCVNFYVVKTGQDKKTQILTIFTLSLQDIFMEHVS